MVLIRVEATPDFKGMRFEKEERFINVKRLVERIYVMAEA